MPRALRSCCGSQTRAPSPRATGFLALNRYVATAATGVLFAMQTGLIFAQADGFPGQAVPQERPAETPFRSIFDGKDLAGWQGNSRLWFVKDGAITGQTTAESPAKKNTFLIWTNGTVDDFELRCSFKIVPNNNVGFANSGIQYRSKISDADNWVVGGYQADMEAGPRYTGTLYEEGSPRGTMAERGEKVVWGKDCRKQVVGSLGDAGALQAAIKPGDWNEYVIIAEGNHLRQFINGKQTVDVIDECEERRALSGVIALQLHAGPPMTVQFKDLQIKYSKALSRVSASGTNSELQGVWQVMAMENNGTALPTNDLTGATLTVKGNSYRLGNAIGALTGSFSVDAGKTPKRVNLLPSDGSADGAGVPGIYDLEAGRLRICYGAIGGVCPTGFTTENAERTMITCKRKEP
jgi:uncharacterized protein (TIGR03067 family)